MSIEKYNMEEVVNSLIPFDGYQALTIIKWIFIKRGTKLRQKTYTHEAIHYEQWKECLILLFLPIYVLEYVIKLLCTFNHDKAYRSISFEQEAYKFENYITYPEERKAYYWVRYIFKLASK
jgi:hypothetical protein